MRGGSQHLQAVKSHGEMTGGEVDEDQRSLYCAGGGGAAAAAAAAV